MTDRPALLDPDRLRRFGAALLFAQGVAAVVLVLGSQGVATASGGRLGGDFPAFYAAGLAVLQGRPEALYDPVAQAALQEPLLGQGARAILFPYPPLVAAAYALLALLPFKAAFTLHTLLMGATAGLGGALVARQHPRLQRHVGLAVLATLAFPPLFRAGFGGQNTGLTLLLAAGVTTALMAGRPALAGVLLGILCFKPQYAAVLTVLVLAGGGWRVLPGLLATLAVAWGLGAAWLGADWPLDWGRAALEFATIDAAADLARSIAPGAWAPPPLDLVVGGILLAGCAWAWRRAAPEGRAGLGALALLLVPPHVGWYDVGLLAIPLLTLVGGGGTAALAVGLGVVATIATVPEPPVTTVLTALVLAVGGLTLRLR